jgi:hypothetical protein
MRQGHWAVVDLVGKGGHIRTVPIPNWVKAALDQWTLAAGVTEGRVFRAVGRMGKVWGNGISQNVVWYVVKTCCARTGLEQLSRRGNLVLRLVACGRTPLNSGFSRPCRKPGKRNCRSGLNRDRSKKSVGCDQLSVCRLDTHNWSNVYRPALHRKSTRSTYCEGPPFF